MDFDPIRPISVLIAQAGPVLRQKFVEHHAHERRVGIDGVDPVVARKRVGRLCQILNAMARGERDGYGSGWRGGELENEIVSQAGRINHVGGSQPVDEQITGSDAADGFAEKNLHFT